MKTIIALVVEDDAKTWAQRHGITESEAATDFAATVRRAVTDGRITDALDTTRPTVPGRITAHMIDQLDTADRDTLRDLLREAQDADGEQALLTEITQRLAADPQGLDGHAARWVIFTVREWDDGYFLTGSDATVYFADGDKVPFDFDGCSVDDILTDLYGARGSTAALGVDLRTGALEFDDYHDNVPDLLGIPTCGHRIS
jgi:hypothetical protein